MENIEQYKFLDIDGIKTLKAELDKVINNSELSAKEHANSLAENYDKAGAADIAETNAKNYCNESFEWGEF